MAIINLNVPHREVLIIINLNVPVNLNGNSIIAKKRAMDDELREDLDALIEKSGSAIEMRKESLAGSAQLVQEVRKIKSSQMSNLDNIVFNATKKLGRSGLKVFVAKKPIDVAEYIRDIVGERKIGIVPSPQTIEAEVMQAFFISNAVEVLSDKYVGQNKGMPFLHPYFPYPREKGRSPRSDAKSVIISAVAVTDTGALYLEKEEAEALKRGEVFVIATVDRLFSDADAEKVVELMEVASGGLIKAGRVEGKGHLILFDNNRMSAARSNIKDVLMCINCYACSLYCPVYLTVGGLFGSPMMAGIGSVSAGYQSGVKMAVNRGLAYCTLCKRCETECPTGVPIVQLIGRMKEKAQVSGV